MCSTFANMAYRDKTFQNYATYSLTTVMGPIPIIERF